MPSIENPSYYERSSGDIANGDMSQFFRNVTENETTEDTGSTESPLGWVGLLEVDAKLVCYMTTECLPSDQFFDAVPSPGWYIVKRDDNGLVWGMQYGYGTFNEENARADFAEAQNVSAAWDRAEDGDYSDLPKDGIYCGGECICDENHESTECEVHPTCQGDHKPEGGVIEFEPGTVWLNPETGEFTRD